MTRFGWMVVVSLAAIVVLAGVVSWLYFGPAEDPATSSVATTTPDVNPADLSIYTSGEYGFSLFYPSVSTVSDAYTQSSTSEPVPWRLHATATGTPIVRISKGTEEVRVGMSDDSDEVAACLKAGPGEEARGSFAVGSTTWQEFMFEKLGTDDESDVTSYRIIHDKGCYAIEVLEPLGGAPQGSGYSLKDVITSFTFAD
jgi:hypothetical protein